MEESSSGDQSAAERRTPNWPHAPIHRLGEGGAFMVTAGTYLKAPLFLGKKRLQGLHDGLQKYAKKYEWRLEAWTVFSNHYHFVGHSPEGGAETLKMFLADFHQHSAAWVNRLDKKPGRVVWCNFWDTRLTYENSLLARLNYVHHNAVKHGLVLVANQYPWCSAAWFERTATPAQIKTVYGFKTDQLRIPDDF